MAQKLKDHYDMEYARMLSDKLQSAAPSFDAGRFLEILGGRLENLEFGDRQVLLATAIHECLREPYPEALALFMQILGPELEGSLGMFTEGYWLWPIGKYVELYGAEYFEESTAFSKELTKRFTGEYCMRPLLRRFPERTVRLMAEWSLDENQRVRRLASECLRVRLPWAKKCRAALDHFDLYMQVLSNLRDDPDKTIQKSVANNLNDLYREAPDKFETILASWQKQPLSPGCAWIIKHASRTKRKEGSGGASGAVTVFPVLEEVRREMERLRVELSMLLAERDQLRMVECKNIEMAYMLTFGSLHYQVYQLECSVRRLQRKIEMIRARKNRQEAVILSEIEVQLDREFADYQARLDEYLDRMNRSIERSRKPFLTEGEAHELKKLYREVVKALHPDLHPDATASQLTLFRNAVEAYEDGDLDTMRLIRQLVAKQIPASSEYDAIAVLVREKDRLLRVFEALREEIRTIRNDYPYTLKEIIQSEEKTAEKKAELERLIREWEQALACCQDKLKTMLR